MNRRILDIHTHIVPAPPCAVRSLKAGEEVPSGGGLFSVGIHPWQTAECSAALPDEVRRALRLPSVVALGEVGLDRLRGAALDVQAGLFRVQAQMAEEAGKPVVIHCVRAWAELLALHSRLRPSVPWVVHGFRGGAALARQLWGSGMMLSFGARFNAEALAGVPDEYLLAETDEWTGGIESVIGRIAETRGKDYDAMCGIVADNAARILKL